ncbi:BTAD domain-containing putative transcriptional regulator [Dactylosporangium sp. NPDC051485]|uniref:BTAD domain-containing putative transcriptional regulator n=1 Tax=Dactylosporangium sp. NPDC051485 TaxID=3154846 RepID=UPI00341B02CA
MRVGLLGPLTVEVDGRPIEVGGARLRTLLVRLALEPGRFVPVDQLVDALWPDSTPALNTHTGGRTTSGRTNTPAPSDPANAVQSLVSRLRKVLSTHPALESGPRGYRLDIEPADVDACRFERLVADGRRALRADDAPTATRLLREALGLWRGPALADLDDHGAVVARWDELRLAATEDLIEASGFAADTRASAIAELQELIVAHPLRERLAALLVRVLHADGRQAEALAAFEQSRARLAAELGADPSPELRDAHIAVLRAAARPPRAGNLRTPLTSFVGRVDDVERLASQVADSRLVTLVGPGGAGKTRLATTVAATLTRHLSDGAWLVEFAPVAEAEEVPAAVLRTLTAGGLVQQEAAMRPRRGDVLDQLAETLMLPGVLLVLDNCEHVVDAAAKLSEDLLGRCPKLRILATSREPLGILGETLFPVGPLPLPEPPPAADQAAPDHPAAVSAALVGASPAVQLLQDRATAVRPGFTVTDDNARAVVEICRRLDGLPLAIELAAARLRSFTPEQVAARLDDRFRLLTGGSRTALPRHRTLHAVVAWSWDLLGRREREFAESLAVFPGTFDAEAAEAVSGVADAEQLLDTLLDRSLLQVAGDGRVRYRMLETIREFALEELGRRAGVGPARAAHAAHFLALVEEGDPHLRTGAQLEWLERLRPEQDNLHAAVAYACDAGDAPTAYRLGAACGWFWTFEDNHAEAALWLRRILAIPTRPADEKPSKKADEKPGEKPEQQPGEEAAEKADGESAPATGAVSMELRLIVMSMYVVNSGFSGDFQYPPGQFDELVELAAAIPSGAHPFVTLIEPVVLLFRDDSERGAEAIQRRLASSIDTWTRAMLLSILGHLHENDGDIDGMVRDLNASAAAFRRIGERWGLAMTLASLAAANTRRGDFAAAIELFEESIDLHTQLGIRSSQAYLQVNIAALRRHTEGAEAARAALRGFVEDARQAARGVSHAMLELGHLERAAGDFDEADRFYIEAWRLQQGSRMVAPQYKAIILAGRAEVDIARGEHDLARTRLAEAMTLTLSARDMPVVGTLAVVLAGLTMALGDHARAARQLGAAAQLAGARDAANVDWTTRLAALRTVLGEPALETALARGTSMPRAEALELVTP